MPDVDPEDFEEQPYEIRRYKTMLLDTLETSQASELQKKVLSRWHVNDIIKLKGNRLVFKRDNECL